MEVQAYDTSGKNVAKGKKVTKIKGTTDNYTSKPGNITNNIYISDSDAHSWMSANSSNKEEQMLEIDLGKNHDIQTIQVWFIDYIENDDYPRGLFTHVETFNDKKISNHLAIKDSLSPYDYLNWNISL